MSLRREPQDLKGGTGGKSLRAHLPSFDKLKGAFLPVREGEELLISEGFELSELASYGFPGVLAMPFFIDFILGTTVGKVVILGHKGLALKVGVEADRSVKHLHFFSNLPLIAVVTEANSVYTIDIHRRDNLYRTLSGLQWLLLGTDLGKIIALDLVYGYPSNYQFESINSRVNFMKLHPTNGHMVLLGAEDGKVYLISLREGKLTHAYDLCRTVRLKDSLLLTSLCWNPKSDSFAAGYSNGWLAFWDLKDTTQPLLIRTATVDIIDVDLEVALPEGREPIPALAWCQHPDKPETTLIFVGGEEIGQAPRLTVLKFSDQVSSKSKSMHILPSSYPWRSGTLDPYAILLLSTEGTLSGYSVDGESLVLPVLQLIANCPSNFHNLLLAHERATQASRQASELILEGGIHQPRQVDHLFYDLILTSHGDGAIRLWDASSNVLSPLQHVTVVPSILKGLCDPLPILLVFSVDSGCIIAGYSDNSIKRSQLSTAQNPSEDDHPPTGFYVNVVSEGEGLGSRLAFEILGHRGELAALETKFGVLAASDKSGRFRERVDLQRQRIVFSEVDISELPGVGSERTSEPSCEYLVKLHLSPCDAGVRVVGVSNLSNGYVYLILASGEAVVKGLLFSKLFQSEEILGISVDSCDVSINRDQKPSPALPMSGGCDSEPSSDTPPESGELEGFEATSMERKKTLASRLKHAIKDTVNEAALKRSLTLGSLTAGCLVDDLQVKPLLKECFRREDRIIVCLSKRIVVFVPHTARTFRDLAINLERGTILKSRPVSIHGQPVMICLKSTGFVDIYKLPGLEVLYRSEGYLSSTFNANQCTITEDGRLVVNVNRHELRQLCLEKDHRASPLCSKVQLFDPSKRAPENAFDEGPWYALPFTKSTPNYVLKLFDKGRPENLTPIDRTRSNKPINVRTYTTSAYQTKGPRFSGPSGSDARPTKPQSPLASDPSESKVGPSSMAAVMALNKAMLREREEKLAGIGDTAQATAETAQDFLHQVRAFNQAQAKKKWYQF
ncbi:Lethal(2) giant larvae sro7 [Massospora cicadina]|nr:Lethal(2) giant larvae sro7 [Massospora cicadina]